MRNFSKSTRLRLGLALLAMVCHCLFGHSKLIAQVPSDVQAESQPSIPDQPKPSGEAGTPSELVELLHDYDQAVEKAEQLDRPLLVILGAEWCGPCKVLEKELQQPVAEDIFRKWIVVKVDIDEEPGLAREWEVGAVPAFRILGVDQGVLASNEGFGGLKKLQLWLEEEFDSSNPRTQRMIQEDRPLDAELTRDLINLLKDKKVSNRKLAIDRLSKNRNLAVADVVRVLGQGNLSQKICALEMLTKWEAPTAGIDPWEPDTITENKMKLLDEWLKPASEKTTPDLQGSETNNEQRPD